VQRREDAEQAREILAGNHVEKLGVNLFSKYLLAVEVAGTLLLVALVGAVAIVSHGESSIGPTSARAASPAEGPTHG